MAKQRGKSAQREIAERLKLTRECIRFPGDPKQARYFTCSQMARKLGIAPQRWHSYETGRRQIDLDVLLKFIREHDLTGDWILLGIEARLSRPLRKCLAAKRIIRATTRGGGGGPGKRQRGRPRLVIPPPVENFEQRLLAGIA